jgi:hypothetical protein
VYGKVTTAVKTWRTTTQKWIGLSDLPPREGATHVAIEATGVGGKPARHLLSDTEFALTLVLAGDPGLPPQRRKPVAGTVLSGPTTFAWSTGAGPQDYELRVGTIRPGSTDPYVKDVAQSVTSIADVEIPANGEKVYVELLYLFNSVWTPINYRFKEGAK